MDKQLLLIITSIVLLGLAIAWVYWKKPKNTSYRTLFIIGVTWLPLGIILKTYAISVVAFILLVIGLANKKKWSRDDHFHELTPEQRKAKITSMLVLAIGVVTLFLVYVLTK